MESDRDALLSIHKAYSDRLMKEGDWIWLRFRIYMTLNAAAFAAVGLLLRDMEFAWNTADLARLIFILVIALIGRSQAIEWTNISQQGRFWESVLNWHISQLEKSLNLTAADLYAYLDAAEQNTNRDLYPRKDGMEHVTDQMRQDRRDPIVSNIAVSDIFKFFFAGVALLAFSLAAYTCYALTDEVFG